jgi:hypothetical protein
MHIPDWDTEFLWRYEPEKLADVYASSNISGPEPFPITFTYRLPAGTTCTTVRDPGHDSELPFITEDSGVSVALDAIDLFGMYLLEYETS